MAAVETAYMADLDHESEATRQAYVATTVTEIASLRAELSGPQEGLLVGPEGWTIKAAARTVKVSRARVRPRRRSRHASWRPEGP